MPITQVSGQSDRYNEYFQFETTDAAVYVVYRYAVPGIVTGRFVVNYNAVNPTTGVAADRIKNVRWKSVNGAMTVPNKGALYSNNDTGMNTVDVDVVAGTNGGLPEIQVTLVGLAGTTIRHTVHIQKLSSEVVQ